MEVKSKGISIKYRLPSVPEKMRLLSRMGMSPSNSTLEYNYETLAIAMENVGELIEEVSVKQKGKTLTSWDEVLQHESLTTTIIEVVTNVLNPPSDPETKKR